MPGKIFSFKVSYALHVFIKHDSWKEFGMGNSKEIPITIVPKPGVKDQF